MGLSSAIGNALDGLATTQAGIDIVARNVANAGTPGYTRKLHNQSTAILGDGSSVIAEAATRQLDIVLQRQLRAERASSGYADTMAAYHARVDALYGQPGGENALDTRLNGFAEALQLLATTPDDFATRARVVDEAGALAAQLNGLASDVQQLRQDAERGIADAVARANELIGRIAELNQQVVSQRSAGTLNPDTLDKRDQAIDELSRLVDLRPIENSTGAVSVFTASGVLLVDTRAGTLLFDERTTIDAASLYSADPLERGVGTITLVAPSGSETDLIRDRAFRSGEIGALVALRDDLLVEAQAQLDELASQLSLALSTTERAGTDVGAGGNTALSLDLSGLQRGDRVMLTFDDGGTARTVTIINTTDPASVSNATTGEAGDLVAGVDLSLSGAALETALGGAIDGAFTAAGLAPPIGSRLMLSVVGTTIRFDDDGAAGTTDVTGLTARVSADDLQGDGLGLLLFVDGAASGMPYTGAYEGRAQSIGFASRIAVNPALVADNALLVAYAAGTSMGDAARPSFLLDRVAATDFTFSPETGIGTATAPFSGSIVDYARAVVTDRGREAAAAQRVKEGQDIVIGGLEERHQDVSSVSIDTELGNLIELQNAYAANARIIQAVQELMEVLLKM